MSPHEYWINDDVYGRATVLMDDPDFLLEVARDDILKACDNNDDDNDAFRPMAELIADVIVLHSVPPDKLSFSGVLVRLYAHARQYHQVAMEAAIEQAKYEFDVMDQGEMDQAECELAALKHAKYERDTREHDTLP